VVAACWTIRRAGGKSALKDKKIKGNERGLLDKNNRPLFFIVI
jgi:hypothetical protein